MVADQSPNGSKLNLFHWGLFRYRFALLLGILVLFLIAAPLMHVSGYGVHPNRARVIITALFGATLIAAVFAVSRTFAMQALAVLVAIPAIILQGAHVTFGWGSLVVPSHILSVVFLGCTVMVLLGYLFSTHRITVNMICASLCAYLLMGVLWAIAYSLLQTMAPGSMVMMPSHEGQIRFGGEHTVYPLYYSFITLTTLGYGDILPVTPVSRMMVAYEAVMGQVYLVVIVARLVGLHIIQGLNPKA